MHNPISTYRIQFHKDFTLADFRQIISYLKDLGIGTLYASPVFKAVPGSTHGYDGLNPLEINPEIGTLEALQKCCNELRKEGIGWLQDIVPNHMGYHSGNDWLVDVFEKGSASQYYTYFDVYTDLEQEPMMAPFLGDTLDAAIKNGDLKIVCNEERCCLQYFDQQYPLRLKSYIALFSSQPPALLAAWLGDVEKDNKEQIVELFQQFTQLIQNAEIKSYVEARLSVISEDAPALQAIAKEQFYRLCCWKETDREINYRRFFTVNGLLCVRIQDAAVFAQYHALIKELVKAGLFTGVRIDHIDGLYGPAEYLARLREMVGDDTYITVEKILEPGELIPKSWPIQGTTGYDFLGMINQLLTNSASAEPLNNFYSKLIGDDTPLELQLRDKKAAVLHNHMGGELKYLANEFRKSGLISEDTLNNLGEQLEEAIAELLIYCPVYRYYPQAIPLTINDAKALTDLLQQIEKDKPQLSQALSELERLWITNDSYNSEQQQKALHLLRRCMQFSGPLMAKGKEDTLMYTFNRFVAHNEVGDGSTKFGMSLTDFHQAMIRRQAESPLALNATATHDTKRGEDVRARLQVLADLSDEWMELAREWINADQQRSIPDNNEKYFLLQTIVGAYPMQGTSIDAFRPRLKEYLSKALREAKTHSDWVEPNEEYEQGVASFADAMFTPAAPLQARWISFQNKIIDFGIINSLVQLLLKCTCPGLPDIYQGAELWDLSLVDPDNRRPVDYKECIRLLKTIPTSESLTEDAQKELWEDRHSGRIKLWLTRMLLQLRKKYETLFSDGMYVPLKVEGKYKAHIIAFARRHDKQWLVVAAGLHTAALCEQQGVAIGDVDWGDTHIFLPPEAPWQYKTFIGDGDGKCRGTLPIAPLFSTLPMAIVELNAPVSHRQAGALLAVSSLPSKYGIGDIGASARNFVDFLSRSCQRIWQLLPLNPIESSTGYSPYSSISAMAGNQWLISPEDLMEEGLLDEDALEQYNIADTTRVNYDEAIETKTSLLGQAYDKFVKDEVNLPSLHIAFKKFCEDEAYWLDDFAMFSVLRKHFNAPWNEWPANYRDRDATALQECNEQHGPALHKVKWLQFIFDRQWKKLRTYSTIRGVDLLGDLPFYMSFDSADVWTYPDIFSLDEERQVKGQAGVPPDYFSEDGQLWGMPTYNWDNLRHTDYDWWIKRLERNLKLFDKVRIDHFRAFQAYWEVPAGEKTARNGEWLKGPGKSFFDKVKAKLGSLPFVAEDLGDEMDLVYVLRDAVGLPGMKVLQFAFGEDMPQSIDIPHNYPNNCIVYTGTHDNNTTVGWYNQEASSADHKRLEQYVNSPVRIENVHEVLARMAYASVADTVILQVQDILGLDAESRMNTPGTGEGNWTWRLNTNQLAGDVEKRLRDWAILFNRF